MPTPTIVLFCLGAPAGRELRAGISDRHLSPPLELADKTPTSCPVGSRRPMLAAPANRSDPPESFELNRVFQRLAQMKELQPTMLSRDPWILQLDGFATANEAHAMIEAAGDHFQPDIVARSSRV